MGLNSLFLRDDPPGTVGDLPDANVPIVYFCCEMQIMKRT
jgi:hypothetical protein